MINIEIIEYDPSLLSEMIELFKNSVRNICTVDYTNAQIEAWVGGDIDRDEWNNNYNDSYTIVAKINNEIVGFANISDTGYLDMMYVHHKFQNRGVASALYNEIERYAKEYYFMTISTHASITAKEFFIKKGFTVAKKQQVIRNATLLENYVCKKFIGQKLNK